jgi:MOSC domain-containing protein YiiM
MPARLLAVNVVHEILRGPSRLTAIDKRPVDAAVAVGELGLTGDTQCDTRHHGGTDKALYAYAYEDAAFWATRLGRVITPGLFGENLTTAGVDITAAQIGERWRIGPDAAGIVVEVRMPRTPCANLSARMGIPRFHHRFAAAGRAGAYLKVITTGSVRAGDAITVHSRPGHGVTIGDLAGKPSPDQMRRLLDSGIDLAEQVRRTAQRIAARTPQAGAA